MWTTCYHCYGSGIEPNKKDINNVPKKENKEIYCQVCYRYRITGENYNFYGQIWIENDYEISTPPNSP